MRIKSLHHLAYRCRDAEETRAFYEDVLGLPLKHVVKPDYVPSTDEYCPYIHIFFQKDESQGIGEERARADSACESRRRISAGLRPLRETAQARGVRSGYGAVPEEN